MSKWTGVVTNAGNALLTEWVNGGTLQIIGVEAGDGTVEEAALLAQTAVSGPRPGAGIVGQSKLDNGVKLRLQIAAPEEGYTLRQLGVWARVDSGAPVLLALYQNREGVPIPSREESPDFVYTFYGAVALDNTGEWAVHVDTSALVSMATLMDELERLKKELLTVIADVSTQAAEMNETLKKKLIYRIANDIWKHGNNLNSHPAFLIMNQKYDPPFTDFPVPEDVKDILDEYVDISENPFNKT